jgi:hypothetical protein
LLARYNSFTISSDDETFTFKTLETTEFIPTPSYTQTCVQVENVHRYLQITRYRRPVYIITGLTVVTGADASTLSSRTWGGTLAVEVDGTVLRGGGPRVEGKVGNKAGTKREGSSDFVFAFRVSKVLVGKVTGQAASEEDYRKAVCNDWQ